MKKLVILVGFMTLLVSLVSCESRSSKIKEIFDNEKDRAKGMYHEDQYLQSNQQMVVCPMCGGTGVFEFIPGDVMAPKQICQGCSGSGAVTAGEAQQMINAINQMNAGGNTNGGYETGNVYEIELALKKAYALLQDMEEQYETTTSGVTKAQYANMIIEQKERIAQLEAELRSAR